VLEDIALSAQTQLVANVPFCAFNGGNDVFVDVGNKSLGLGAMMTFLGIQVGVCVCEEMSALSGICSVYCFIPTGLVRESAVVNRKCVTIAH
jgi:hypothetical protein